MRLNCSPNYCKCLNLIHADSVDSCSDSMLYFNCFDCRIASLSKIFPTLMMYKLWEDGLLNSLDDPLDKYVDNFTIKNPLGRNGRSRSSRFPAVTLRRMASQLSGNYTLSDCSDDVTGWTNHSAAELCSTNHQFY